MRKPLDPITLYNSLTLDHARLHPAWFPANDQATYLHNTERLAYPLNYWNALAALMAIGVPYELATAAVRMSLGSLTTEAGIRRVSELFPALIGKARRLAGVAG